MSLYGSEQDVKDALNDDSIDQRKLQMGERMDRLDRASAWHGADDAANRLSLSNNDTLAKCIVTLNAIKAAYNIHIALIAPTHKIADAINAVATADATNQATADTLADSIQTEFNDHIALGTVHDPGSTVAIGEAAADVLGSLDRINYSDVALASDGTLPTLITLTNDVMMKYRGHTFRGPYQITETYRPG